MDSQCLLQPSRNLLMNMKEEASGIKELFTTLKDGCDELRNNRLFLKPSCCCTDDRKPTLLHFVVKEIIRTEGMRAARAAKDGRSVSDMKAARAAKDGRSVSDMKAARAATCLVSKSDCYLKCHSCTNANTPSFDSC